MTTKILLIVAPLDDQAKPAQLPGFYFIGQTAMTYGNGRPGRAVYHIDDAPSFVFGALVDEIAERAGIAAAFKFCHRGHWAIVDRYSILSRLAEAGAPIQRALYGSREGAEKALAMKSSAPITPKPLALSTIVEALNQAEKGEEVCRE